MLRKAALFFIVFFFFRIGSSYALDWKRLHEKADAIALSKALANVSILTPDPADVYVLGLVCLNLHKDKEAADAFDKVLILVPGSGEAKWGLAEVFRRQHKTQKSEELLSEVLMVMPNFPPANITLAYINYDRMDLNKAVRLAIKVLAQGENVDISNHARAHLIYAGAKGMIAHYGGPLSKVVNGAVVLSNLRAAEKLQPGSAGVKFGLGSFYLLAPSLVGGDIKKAEQYLKKAIEIDPFFIDAYVRLGQLYKFKGDRVRYNDYLNKAQELDSENELALDIKSGRCKFICLDKGRGIN